MRQQGSAMAGEQVASTVPAPGGPPHPLPFPHLQLGNGPLRYHQISLQDERKTCCLKEPEASGAAPAATCGFPIAAPNRSQSPRDSCLMPCPVRSAAPATGQPPCSLDVWQQPALHAPPGMDSGDMQASHTTPTGTLVWHPAADLGWLELGAPVLYPSTPPPTLPDPCPCEPPACLHWLLKWAGQHWPGQPQRPPRRACPPLAPQSAAVLLPAPLVDPPPGVHAAPGGQEKIALHG